MSDYFALIVASCWLTCGTLAYGKILAYFQRTYPSLAKKEASSDKRFAFIYGFIFGPVGLGIALLHCGEGGWMWRTDASGSEE